MNWIQKNVSCGREDSAMDENMIEQMNVWKVLDALKMDIKVDEKAGRSDKVFYQHMCEGVKENNPDKIYEFIDAMERGCGLYEADKIYKLMKKAFEEDSLRLGKTIAERKNLIDCWIFLSPCTPDMIYTLATVETEYSLFYYECARLLLQKIDNDKRTEMYVVEAVKKIAVHDFELWKRWINKNEYNMNWQRIVGEVLVELPAELLTVYAETIHLDMMSERNEIGIITEAFQKISDDRIEYVLSVISEVIYFRWKNSIQEKKKKRKYQSEIIISAYTNIILWSMNVFITENDIWEKEIVDSIEILERDMYEWYENESQMKSVFFMDMTWIYYLLHLKEHGLSGIKTESVLTAVCKFRELLKRLEAFWNQNDVRKAEMESLVNL